MKLPTLKDFNAFRDPPEAFMASKASIESSSTAPTILMIERCNQPNEEEEEGFEKTTSSTARSGKIRRGKDLVRWNSWISMMKKVKRAELLGF